MASITRKIRIWVKANIDGTEQPEAGRLLGDTDNHRLYMGDGKAVEVHLSKKHYLPSMQEVADYADAGDIAISDVAATDATTKANAAQAAAIATAATDATTKANAAQAAAIAAAAADATTKANASEINAKAYTDGLLVGAFRAAGNWDASGGTWPPAGAGTGTAGAIRRGDTFKVSVAGTIGGVNFDAGDSFYANVATPGQTAGNWDRFEHNDDQATESIRGTAFIATQAEAEDSATPNDTDILTPQKGWQLFNKGITLSTFFSAVRGVLLTGLVTTDATDVAATDSIIIGFGKFKRRLNDLITTVATVVADTTHAASSKSTPVDADELPLVDSAASNVLKRLTWGHLKAALNTYFDTIYPAADTVVLNTAKSYADGLVDGLFKNLFKGSDETRSSTTLSADSVLKIPMLANKTYCFEAVLFFDTSAIGDFKYRHSGPATPTRVRIFRDSVIPGTNAFNGISVDTAYSSSDANVSGTVDGAGYVLMHGTISNGANAGDFQILYAQRSSDPMPVTVCAGSWMRYKQVN